MSPDVTADHPATDPSSQSHSKDFPPRTKPRVKSKKYAGAAKYKLSSSFQESNKTQNDSKYNLWQIECCSTMLICCSSASENDYSNGTSRYIYLYSVEAT